MNASVFVLLSLLASGAVAREQNAATANPIRKVVSMLQAMQAKVEAEGATEKALYDQFMCYCATGGSSLSDSISAAETKVPAVSSDITEAEEKNAQTKDALKQAQTERAAADAAVKQATALRNKEAAEFAKLKIEADANIAALTKAVAAIEAGAAGGFLQTSAAQVLQKLTLTMQDESEKQEVLAFLSSAHATAYAPQSGQITGILKQMGDTMNADLMSATEDEKAAVKSYDGLMSAKAKEIAALTASVEAKIKMTGELSVDIVEMKQDLKDTEKALIEDKKFLADLDTSCKTKTAEWDERTKTRGLEIEALADTIKILNDDDALELFKKTLPGSSSFVQVGVNVASVRARAIAAIKAVQSKDHRAAVDFILLAIHGKAAGFEKVLKMVDDMMALLKREQQDDNDKKEYCSKQFDQMDDKRKALDRQYADENAAIESATEGISQLQDEMKALEAGIAALDTSVAEATEQRKQENVEFKALIASNTAAKDLMKFAKNRLNKFYNPRLYVAPAKKELSAEDRIVANMGSASFVQVSSHTSTETAPPPPPETFGAYKTSGKSTGVISMIDLLISDMDKEMTEANQEEKDSQQDYQAMMRDSAEKRTQDSKSLTQKGGAKADMEADLEATKGSKQETMRELSATLEYIQSLHGECDWLLMSFDARMEARTGEIDSLVKAKAILSGADFSLVQTAAQTRNLRSSK